MNNISVDVIEAQDFCLCSLEGFKKIKPSNISGYSHIAQLSADGDVIGASLLEVFTDRAYIKLKYLEIKPSSRGDGMGRLLLRGIFDYAVDLFKAQDTAVCIGSDGLTTDGKLYLSASIDELNSEYASQGVSLEFYQTS